MRPASIPALWLLSDARNDAVLEAVLRRLPRGSGFVYRHYHLGPAARRARFDAVRQVARSADHRVILSGDVATALAWGADGVYGATETLGDETVERYATVHDEHEIAAANAAGVAGVFLSPVFATCSHPGGDVLGEHRFLALAALSKVPVIALGGMNRARARALGWRRWGAIDGLSG